jgi:hypothetical protein
MAVDPFCAMYGTEVQPSEANNFKYHRGMAALVHVDMPNVMLLRVRQDTMWMWVWAGHGSWHVCNVYSPQASDAAGKARLFTELALDVAEYQRQGAIIIGGDMNARLGANGDSESNSSGRQLQSFAESHDMCIVNLSSVPASFRGMPLARRACNVPHLTMFWCARGTSTRCAPCSLTTMWILAVIIARLSSHFAGLTTTTTLLLQQPQQQQQQQQPLAASMYSGTPNACFNSSGIHIRRRWRQP